MHISIKWLKEFIAIEESAEALDHILTMTGLEVEGVSTYEEFKGGLKGLVIGEVLTCEQHPNADKLKVTTVDIGQDAPAHIVCGAPNVAAGQKVVVATIGTTLYPAKAEGFTIKKSKIRGEISEGMICAEDEIGLGNSHDGIMVLATDLPNGTPAAEYFDAATDEVLEIGLTPNRADAASHYGVARDLKAALNRPICFPDTQITVENNQLPIAVEVENPEACPRYAGITLTGVKVAPSPKWLQNLLKAIGLAPINNIVDITNYVLHGLGQPLHAFDADKLVGKKIVVRTGLGGQKFTTLDGVERQLLPNDLMICDAAKPVCIAGVFGGADSGITANTQSVFIESAYFDPGYVRKTSMAHGLKTDASFRFERGVDPNMTIEALKYAAKLIKEIAGGTISSEIVDVYPSPIPHFEVTVHYQHINRLIGIEIPKERVKAILTALDISIQEERADGLLLSIPPYRVDVQREADVIEEILRIYGYNNVALSEHLSTSFLANFPEKDPEEIRLQLGRILSGDGYQGIMTNSISSWEYADWTGQTESAVKLLNPLSSDLDVMRQNLLFSGLEVVRHNLNRRQNDLKLFEFGKSYRKSDNGYTETQQLCLMLTGSQESESWMGKQQPSDFHTLLKAVEKIFKALNIEGLQQHTTESQLLGYGLSYHAGKSKLADVGIVKPNLLLKMDIEQPVFYAEIAWGNLLKRYNKHFHTTEISKFPEVRRDLSLLMDKSLTFQEVKDVAYKTEKKLLKRINVFDVYQGPNLGEGKKSYSVSFILQDADKTLTDKQIDKTMKKLIGRFEQELSIIIRQ